MSKILFVDDDKVTLKLMKSILESAGYEVLAYSDALEAYEKMQEHPVDLVISDANMPGVSGFNFVKTLRSDDRFKNLPIAILTGRREKRDIQLGMQVGADDYIIKPIDPLIILGKVESLLKKRPPEVRKTNFAEKPVGMKAEWNVELQITMASERGLTLRSALPAQVDTKIRIKCDFFGLIGIEPPLLRVTGFLLDSSATPPMYTINTTYVGVSDGELQRIRNWLITSTPKAS